MRALVCGSVAYDSIMVFHDRFKNHILPEKVHMLSVSFLVPEMRKEFGGCAGNIAYNGRMLGLDVLPMATVGKDFQAYSDWMDQNEIPRLHVSIVDTEFTAQAFITTDLDDNQITAFHPGAMSYSHLNDVGDAESIRLGIVAPDGRDGMIRHAEQFADADIPFIFDPGQGLPMFEGPELETFIDQATYLALNDYEWALVQEKTGLNPRQIGERLKAIIVTRGGEGSRIHTGGQVIEIPPARAASNEDPTGAGDAYRAGLVYGLLNELDWDTTGRIASLMGCLAIERHGTQNHGCSMDEIRERFASTFGRSLD